MQQICYLGRFLEKFNLLFEKSNYFLEKNQILHVLSLFTTSVAFYGKFSTFNFKRFWKISIFCVKKPIYFLQPNFFEKFYYLSRFLRHFFYLERFQKTSINLICFFKKTQIFNFLRIFPRSVAFYGKLSTFNF